VRGLIGSAGGTRAVQDADRAPVRAAIEAALAPFTDPSTGAISMHNAMRWATARRPLPGDPHLRSLDLVSTRQDPGACEVIGTD
jgi:hypothetical protein